MVGRGVIADAQLLGAKVQLRGMPDHGVVDIGMLQCYTGLEDAVAHHRRLDAGIGANANERTDHGIFSKRHFLR